MPTSDLPASDLAASDLVTSDLATSDLATSDLGASDPTVPIAAAGRVPEPATTPDDLLGGIRTAARADVRWHELAFRTLGLSSETHGGVWVATDPASPVFLSAITTDPGTTSAEVTEALDGVPLTGAVCDSFARLDLTPLGLVSRPGPLWMIRDPGPPPPPGAALPAGVTIRRCSDVRSVARFERTSFIGFTGDPHLLPPASVHPPLGTTAVADLHLFLAELDGEPVGTSLAAVTDDVVHVTAVTVVASARRAGVGAALTAAAFGVAPDRPATLGSSDVAVSVYERLGFTALTHSLHWRVPNSN